MVDDHLTKEAIKEGGFPEGWNEVKVDYFKFEHEGDYISGRLISKTVTTVRGNKLGKYTLMRENGSRVTFLGSVDLDEKMAGVPQGNLVHIQYTHQEKTDQDGFMMKRFRVGQKQSF